MPKDINVNFFIELNSHEGFDVHGTLGHLMQGVAPDLTRYISTLQPWMPNQYPILLTKTNKKLFIHLDEALHDDKTVMQMGVYFGEFFGKKINPVVVYFTRPYIDGETLSSDDMFLGSVLVESSYNLEIKERQTKIFRYLGENPLKKMSLALDAPIDLMKLCAESGIASAQNTLGAMLHHGRGCIRNDPEATAWFRKAADQGLANAQNNLATILLAGPEDEAIEREAIFWMRKAAEQGHMESQNNLGYLLANGIGCDENEEEAAIWHRKAADQGHAEAQYQLGLLLIKNDRHAEAIAWCRRAADQGHADAQCIIGHLFENGIRCEKDEEEAIRWYRSAAQQGNELAQSRLDFLEL